MPVFASHEGGDPAARANPGGPDAAVIGSLNPAQREAVLHHTGPMLVLAGAGSGKTRVLTTRVARLVGHHRVHPSAILAVTFTNKAAGEMRERIERLLGAPPSGMWVGTFHAIGARLLRANAEAVHRTVSFTIYDQDDTLALIKRLMEQRGVNPREYAPKAVLAAISDAKNALVSEGEYRRLALDPFARVVSDVYGDMEPALRRLNAVTFDDLLLLPVRLLERDPELLERYRRRFQYLLVDEYQDTNAAQYQFVKLLAGSHGNVMVVGDDDQSIYGWRGADIRNILDFEKDFPNARLVRLEENYRSTPGILQLANHVISANAERRGKTLRATRPAGERVSVVAAADERDEADFVAGEILDRRAASSRLGLRDFAILYRTNAQSRAMEEAMRRRAIPYRLIGAVRFYDRREIRDLMAYLKLIANPFDDEAFRRAIATPRRGVGETSVATLAEAAREHSVPLLVAATRGDLVVGLRPAARVALAEFASLISSLRERARDAAVDELLRELVDAIRYEDLLLSEGPEGKERMENVRELLAGAVETVTDEGGEVGLTPLDTFLQGATLVAGADGLDPSADAVVMMTMHNAKGLEFPVVFVTGLEDGLFPLARAYEEPSLLEEERRLFYVGITRAESKLLITHAEQRRRNGELLSSRPSSFLATIPDTMVDTTQTPRARSSGRAYMASIAASDERRWSRDDSRAPRRGGGSYSGGGHGSLSYGGRAAGGRQQPSGQPHASRDRERGRATDASTLGWGSGGARDVARREVVPAAEDVSQDAAVIAVGARVRHAMFGAGTIAELSGNGIETKARIDFDDEDVGRKTLVLARANLEREWE